MLIKLGKRSDVKPSEITHHSAYLDRRSFMAVAATLAGGALFPSIGGPAMAAAGPHKFTDLVKSKYTTLEKPTGLKAISGYNNFYEFGTGKSDPSDFAGSLKPRPWKVEIAGHAEKTGSFDLDDLISPHKLEERIYRMRCVEAWSMIIPWVGVPLGDVLKRFGPTSKAKYVAFETLVDAKQMPGQKRPALPWPYVEGLRMDEAMNPLSLLAVGVYGQEMPNQNGAPIRLVVPWKYGFKGIKSIVRISFTDKQPPTSWSAQAPREYGFYSNVNPDVSHPRWSQAKERRITGKTGFRALFAPKVETKMFNGYAEEVAQMYAGLDLKKNY